MANCNSIENILKGCDNNPGGIYTAYIFDMDDIGTFTESEVTWSVTGLTMSGTASAESFYFKRNTSDFTDEATIDLVSGATFYKKNINLVFHRRDAAKSRAIKILGEGQRYLGAVIGNANGDFWYFDYMQLSADAGGSGKARGDGSNYNITLTGEGNYSAKTISSVIAASIL